MLTLATALADNLAPPSPNLATSGFKKPSWRWPKCLTQALRMVERKPMGDITVATSTSFVQSVITAPEPS